MTRKYLSACTAFVLTLSYAVSASAQTDANAPLGVWLNMSKEGYIQVYEDGGKYYGQIVGAPLDSKRRNEDGKSLLGTLILDGFVFDGDELWKDGTVYDPDNDNTYSSKMWMPDANTLKIRGYLGLSLLGRTVVWSRTTADAPGVEQDQLR